MSINVYANALLESFYFLSFFFVLLHFIQCFLDAKERKAKEKTSSPFLPQITYRMAEHKKLEKK